jgi:hypothetical protein
MNTLDQLMRMNINGNINQPVNISSLSLNLMSKLPLFSTQIGDRISHETRKNKINIFSFEDTIIENFPIRDYLKFEILFKLIMFFILFGFQIKGYNLPIFISLLILYYW